MPAQGEEQRDHGGDDCAFKRGVQPAGAVLMLLHGKKMGALPNRTDNDEIDNESGDESFVNEFTNRV